MSVRTTMTLTDRMTGTLHKMMKAMNSTIRTMEQMHISSNRAGDMRSLQRATVVIQSASVAFNRLGLVQDLHIKVLAMWVMDL